MPRGPKNQVVTKENSVAQCGITCIETTNPINIRVYHKVILRRRPRRDPCEECHEHSIMCARGQRGEAPVGHACKDTPIELNCIGDIRSSESDILKSSCKAAKIHGNGDAHSSGRELQIHNRVEQVLQSTIPARSRIQIMYYCCERKRPDLVCWTCIPRKSRSVLRSCIENSC